MGQKTRGRDMSDGRHTRPAALTESHTVPLAAPRGDELPSVEEALDRLSRVMQRGAEWLVAQDMAAEARAQDMAAEAREATPPTGA